MEQKTNLSIFKTRLSPGRAIVRVVTTLMVVSIALMTSPVWAEDFCRFYSGNEWNGTSKNYPLASSGSLSGYNWGATSFRRTGKELKNTNSIVYKNAESVRIKAQKSDVVLYVFTGEHFDGKFQALRVKKGSSNFKWKFGSMRNKIRSFICQRDKFIPPSASAVSAFLNNHILPMSFIADSITAMVHERVKKEKKRFYSISLKRGRISWSTRYNICREINCSGDENLTGRRKFKDYLKFSYKSRGKLKADGAKYDINVTLWFQPVLDHGELEFRQRGWKVKVSKHIWHKKIRDKVSASIRKEYDTFGKTLTNKVQKKIKDLLGNSTGGSLIKNNRQLLITHPCIYQVQRVGYADYTFSSSQIDNFCAGGTPTAVAAPAIRLLK